MRAHRESLGSAASSDQQACEASKCMNRLVLSLRSEVIDPAYFGLLEPKGTVTNGAMKRNGQIFCFRFDFSIYWQLYPTVASTTAATTSQYCCCCGQMGLQYGSIKECIGSYTGTSNVLKVSFQKGTLGSLGSSALHSWYPLNVLGFFWQLLPSRMSSVVHPA